MVQLTTRAGAEKNYRTKQKRGDFDFAQLCHDNRNLAIGLKVKAMINDMLNKRQ